MSGHCEPPLGLRGQSGWHIIQMPNHAGNPQEQMAWFETPTKGRPKGFWFIDRRKSGVSPYEATACGWRYLAPATPPATVAALVEALEWFIDNDDTNEGDTPLPEHGGRTCDEINAYWLDGLNKARAALALYREGGR